MASRFYYAPINPGYDQFGAAIAAGMGQGVQNFQRGQATQEEQRRYEAQMARQAEADRLAAQDRNIRMAMLGRRELGRELAPANPSALNTPLPQIPIPASGEIPAGRVPGIGIGAALGGLQAPPAAPGGMAPGGLVAAGADVLGVPAPAAPPAGLSIPEALSGRQEFRSQAAPEGAIAYSEDGRDFYFDPTASYDYRTQVAHEDRQEQRASEKRDEIQTMVASIVEDGIVTPDERAWLVANGLKETDLQDPAEAQKKAETWWHTQQKTLHQHRVAEIDRRGAIDRSLTTGNRRDDNLKMDVAGQAVRLFEQGVKPAEIARRLAQYAEALGGPGVLDMVIRKGLDDYAIGISPQAASAAHAALDERGIYPDDPRYAQQFGIIGRVMQEEMAKDRVRLGEPAEEAPVGPRYDPTAEQGSRENPLTGGVTFAAPPANRISAATGATPAAPAPRLPVAAPTPSRAAPAAIRPEDLSPTELNMISYQRSLGVKPERIAEMIREGRKGSP
jgi:hypothetical protein